MMDENENAGLDMEYKRYLKIIRPHLEQLVDEDVIDICKAWIQRLSNCIENEKSLRNKYIFTLCYQLTKGILSEPFLKFPSEQELSSLNDKPEDSDISLTEIDHMILNCEEDNTNVLFINKNLSASKTDLHSLGHEYNEELQLQEGSCRKRSLIFTELAHLPIGLKNYNVSYAEHNHRANNLVIKLRQIKTQNMLLQKELDILRQDLKIRSNDGGDHDNITKVGTICTRCCHSKESITTLNTMKAKLQEHQVSKHDFIRTIEHLQAKLDSFEEFKKCELDEIKASHNINITKIKTSTREETKEFYEKKIEELKQHYEIMIENVKIKLNTENQQVISAKDRIISEKEHIINDKNNEIVRLRNLNDDQKSHLQGVIQNFLEKSGDDSINDSIKHRAEQLEKSLNKAEKAKSKCVKVYEAKLANMQREKHLVECSMQLQMVRQRAQVVNDLTEENQSEVSTALNRLERKYKEIVGNVQATAIQRRVQDQIAIDTIVHAACEIRNGNYANCSQGTNRGQFSGKTMQNQNRNGDQINQSEFSEISALLNGNKIENLVGGNKSLNEGNVMPGYCLDGERMGELFERVYIPQRDIGDGPLKK